MYITTIGEYWFLFMHKGTFNLAFALDVFIFLLHYMAQSMWTPDHKPHKLAFPKQFSFTGANRYLFYHVNDHDHKLKSLKAWLAKDGWEALRCPAFSLHFKPIGHIYDTFTPGHSVQPHIFKHMWDRYPHVFVHMVHVCAVGRPVEKKTSTTFTFLEFLQGSAARFLNLRESEKSLTFNSNSI